MEADSTRFSDQLRGFHPFDRLGERDRCSACRLFEPLTLRKGKALYYQGDRAERCWILLSGRIRGLMYRSDESILSLGFSSAGDWLGLAEMLLSSPYLNDAVAEESSFLAGIRRVSFQRLLMVGDVREHFLREMARRYYVLHARLELATPLDRLISYLLERCPTETEMPITVTQEQIAEAIGASRETVNRHLALLSAQGALRLGRGFIQITDAEALGKLLSQGS